MRMSFVTCTLALSACARAPELAHSPSNTSSTAVPRTFAELVNGVPTREGREVDGTALGQRVDVYLVKRFGTWTSESQRLELMLVLAGDRSTIRLSLDELEVGGRARAPFGELEAAPACGQDASDPACDAFGWASVVPSVAMTASDRFDAASQWSVSIRGDELVVLGAAWTPDGAGPEQWQEHVIALAPGAIVHTPAPTIEPQVLGDPVVVRVIAPQLERAGFVFHEVWLQVGNRMGRGDLEIVPAPDRQRWNAPAIEESLPPPLPAVDGFIAHRVYEDDTGASFFLLGRVGDDVVGWRRAVGASVIDEGWRERLRVPVPAGAQLAFEAPP